MTRMHLTGVAVIFLVVVISACSNPHKRAARASASVDEKKAMILDDYRKCMRKYPDDASQCESYRKALDSL